MTLLVCVGFGCSPETDTTAIPAESAEPTIITVPASLPTVEPQPTAEPKPQLRYIFLFIGDGMSTPQIQAAGDALAAVGRSPLSFTDFPVCGYARTGNINGDVTDSAAAVTAFSTGQKTENGYLGLDANQDRLDNIAEVFRDEGRKIGILTTVALDHATPAGFFAHVNSRRSYALIADDLFACGFDFFAGGGFHDTPNVEELANENGYALIRSPNDAPADIDGRLIVSSNLIFGDYGVLPAIDGGERAGWLAESTLLAIDRLTQENGFFMMVEGGRIDYFCHYNDAASFVAELLDFDQAVAAGIAFYEAHPYETLILVTGDHETGHVSLTDGDRSALLKQTISSDECDDTIVAECITAQTPFSEALPLFAKAFGLELDSLSEDERNYLETAYRHTLKGDLTNAESRERYGVYEPITGACDFLVAQRAGLTFGSGSHSLMDVPVFALGVGQELFSGEYENTYIHDGLLLAAEAYPID